MLVAIYMCFFSSSGVYESFAWIQSKQSTSPLKLESESSNINDLPAACYLSGRKFSLVCYKCSEKFSLPDSFCNKNSSHSQIYEIIRKLYYILSLCCYNFWLHKDVHNHHSQVLATFFILKTFLYLIDLQNLTDMRKCSVFFFFFPLHNHHLSNIVKYPICFLPLHRQIFQTRKSLLQCWP